MRAVSMLGISRLTATLIAKCVLVLAALVVLGTADCQASPIVYTISGIGDGVFGAYGFFRNQPFTITTLADTNDIREHDTFANNYFVPNQSTTVSVPAFGSLRVLDQTVTQVNQNAPRVGVYAPLWPQTGLFVDSAAFADYKLLAPLSLVIGTPTYNAGQGFFMEDRYYFNLNWVAAAVTFQAVPEPSTFELLGLSAFVISVWFVRRKVPVQAELT